jgi:hypothetical protein
MYGLSDVLVRSMATATWEKPLEEASASHWYHGGSQYARGPLAANVASSITKKWRARPSNWCVCTNRYIST